MIPETLDCTTLGGLGEGSRVNLERALRWADRLDGHLVQGHVDAVAPLVERIERGADHRLRVGMAPELARFIAYKGSVALHGVSLTVLEFRPDRPAGVAREDQRSGHRTRAPTSG